MGGAGFWKRFVRGICPPQFDKAGLHLETLHRYKYNCDYYNAFGCSALQVFSVVPNGKRRDSGFADIVDDAFPHDHWDLVFFREGKGLSGFVEHENERLDTLRVSPAEYALLMSRDESGVLPVGYDFIFEPLRAEGLVKVSDSGREYEVVEKKLSRIFMTYAPSVETRRFSISTRVPSEL